MRLILLEVEAGTPVDLCSYGTDQVLFHKALIKDGGLAEGMVNYRLEVILDLTLQT